MNTQMQKAKAELLDLITQILSDVNGRTISLGRTPLWSRDQLLQTERDLDDTLTSLIDAISVQTL